MQIKFRRSSFVYVIDVSGDMDLYNSHQLIDVVHKMMKRNIRYYVLNLDNLEYIDSRGIGVIILVYSETKDAKIHIRIANINGQVKKIFELTKLIGFLPIVESVGAGVEQLREQGVNEKTA